MAAEIIAKYVSKIWPGNSNLDDTEIEFLGSFPLIDDPLNGLNFEGLYIPEEVMLNIFANLSPDDILKCSLVCKTWYNIAKSNTLWQTLYNKKEYPKKAKLLPWYVFYSHLTTDNFKNLLKNGNGEEEFKYWEIIYNGGDRFCIEKVPQYCEPLPEGVPEFRGYTSCFATSYMSCLKLQRVHLKSKRLLRYIIKKHKPCLYASEWFTGRKDCACAYQLTLSCDTKESKWEPSRREEMGFTRNRPYHGALPIPGYFMSVQGKVEQWEGKPWEKLEVLYNDYPEDIDSICFCHEGRDLQFWAGHYGSKMAGGVLKFVFESIKPVIEDMGDIDDVTLSNL